MGFVYAFIGSMAMEFILSDVGLGFMVNYNYNYFETPKMYAYIVIGLSLPVLMNSALGKVERRIRDRSEA